MLAAVGRPCDAVDTGGVIAQTGEWIARHAHVEDDDLGRERWMSVILSLAFLSVCLSVTCALMSVWFY